MTSDAAVIGRVRAGDVDAFSLLVDRYHDRCVRLAMRLLGDPDEAADAVQDAFIRAYDSLDRYQERDRFASWLLCIVANRCHTAASATRRRARVAGEWWRLYLEPATTSGGGTVSERDHALAEQLSIALSELPQSTRSAVISKYADELSYEEIAADTGVGVSALKMRVARGSAQLRRVLAGAGVTVAAIALILVTHGPHRAQGAPDAVEQETRPATTVACDTLRAIMRDTLDQTMRDTLLPPERCAPDTSIIAAPERNAARAASTTFEKRGL